MLQWPVVFIVLLHCLTSYNTVYVITPCDNDIIIYYYRIFNKYYVYVIYIIYILYIFATLNETAI